MGISGQLYKHTETDVAEFNVTALLSEMETGERYHLPPEKPEEHVYPYASPLEELRAIAEKVEGVKDGGNTDNAETAVTTSDARSQRRSRRQKKKVNWPPLSTGFDNVDVVLLS